MLTCAFCGADNPDTDTICGQCGHPLSVWRLIVVAANGRSSPGGSSPSPALMTPPTLAQIDPDGLFVGNEGQRYRLQEGLQPGDRAGWWTGRVVDSQPQQPFPIAAQLEQDNAAAALPLAARPYVALQFDCYPSIPELHHTWKTPTGMTVLLVESRRHWDNLAVLWQSPVPLVQKIQWLYETVLLWEALTPWHREGSLLPVENLKLDDRQILCLDALLANNPTPNSSSPNRLGYGPNSALPPAQLAQMWQQVIESAPAAESPPLLMALVQAVATGALADLAQVKHQLAVMAEHYQAGEGDDDSHLRGNLVPPPPESDASPTVDSSLDPFVDPTQTPTNIPSVDTLGSVSEDSTEAPTMMLPMELARLDDAGRTHVGQQRTHNEDCFYTYSQSSRQSTPHTNQLQAKGIFILCDGMGGHASGEVASQLAVTTLQQQLQQQQTLPNADQLCQAIVAANQAIYSRNQQNASSGSGRMGTTLVMLLVHNLEVAVAHVGDSRLYSYGKQAGLRQLTQDHEVGQREINRGVEPALAYARPDAYQLTQALGPRDSTLLRPGVSYHEVTEDTLFLLCSDGLSDHGLVEDNVDEYIAPLLRTKADLHSGLDDLISLANKQNGHDNITAILVRLKLRPSLRKLAV